MPAIEERLRQLGMPLPDVPKPVSSYIPATRFGALAVTSGQLPFVDGHLIAKGHLGRELTEEDGYKAAKTAALNCLAALATVIDLDKVAEIVRIVGYVQSDSGFIGQATVVGGASDLIRDVFGDKGHHARTAIGVLALPLGAPVEVEVWARIED